MVYGDLRELVAASNHLDFDLLQSYSSQYGFWIICWNRSFNSIVIEDVYIKELGHRKRFIIEMDRVGFEPTTSAMPMPYPTRLDDRPPYRVILNILHINICYM